MRCAFGLVLALADRFRHGRFGRAATVAALAAALASVGSLAGVLDTISIVSNPGGDGTYSSDGEDSTIIFRATWVEKVSVRGANLVFVMGDEEREAFCPQTGDCDTCPVFNFECTYEVQPGDLDEDGISIQPASVRPPFAGSITRNNSNINQATCTSAEVGECTYPGLPDQAGHKVDGGPAEASEPDDPEEPDEPADPDQGSDGHTGRTASALLGIGPPEIGTIDGADDVDYYRIDLAGSATVTVATAGPTDTRGELLAGNGALIASDSDSGPGGNNFQLTEALEAGVYYVAVSGSEGGYALTALLADAGDQGGTAASSTLLTLYGAAEVESVSAIGSSALLSTVGSIDEAMADLDYFRIDVPRDGTDVTVRSAGSTDTAGRLLDSALMEVAAEDGGDGNFQIEATLDAGTYYVEVMGETGRYRVLASGSDPDCACAEEAMAMGDHGGTDETSTLMPIGPPLTGTIADGDDADVFRIDLAGDATVVFETAGPTDTMGVLRSGAGEELASADGGGPAMNFSIAEELAAGVYYLEVSGGAGSYAVNAQLGGGDADHGDTAGLSTLLTLYSQDDVDNIRPQALLSTAAQIDAAETDMDVFRLDVPMDMTDVTIRSAGSLDTYAYLRDADGMELAMDDSDGAFRIEATLDAGVYYVAVGGHETGRYRVLAWGDSQVECDCAGDGGEDDDGS